MTRRWIKEFAEKILGCKIYRGWFPRGTNLEFDLTRIIQASSPTIVDVGANQGLTAIALSNQFPDSTIYACEPVQSNYQNLKNAVQTLSNVKPFAIAMGSVSGRQKINLYEGNVNHSLQLDPNRPPLGTETIEVTTLDKFCSEQAIHMIDFLKVDTEGFDLEVLMGASQLLGEGRIGSVLAELGFSGNNQKHVPFVQFEDYMREQQMSLFGIYDQRREFDGNHNLRRADCLFVSNAVDLSHLDNDPDV